jgi:DNA-binding MarR family transcriptional regulator
MENKITSAIVENLFYVLPILHKTLLKVDPPDISPDIRISRLHVGIMAALSEDKLRISEIAKKFLMPKPQMTVLINQLFKAGIVERKASIIDRRAVEISLSEKGKEIFLQCHKHLKTSIEEKLSCLSDAELNELSLSLSRIRNLGAKIKNL